MDTGDLSMFMTSGKLLFNEKDLQSTLRAISQGVLTKVNEISKDQFLNTDENRLVEHVVDTLAITPLTIYPDKMEMDQQETKIDLSNLRRTERFDYVSGHDGPVHIDGVKVTVSLPYTGDAELWDFRPSTYHVASCPRGTVRHVNADGVGHMDIIFEEPSGGDLASIKGRLDSELNEVEFYLNQQRQEIETFLKNLPDTVRQAIVARRKRLGAQQDIPDMLGIPLKKHPGAPAFKPINARRKLVRPLPPPPASGYKPELGIAEDTYDHILSVIRHEGRTFETTPKTFHVHTEEELRDILLAHLNGHYEGAATGETFRKTGKTDIRIEENSRAAFVAECKVWRGPASAQEACDQIGAYTIWRDCKGAIIIFNKNNARFNDLLEAVPQAIRSHRLYVREVATTDNGEWRFVLKSADDEAREITVHLFLFNLYVAEHKSKARKKK